MPSGDISAMPTAFARLLRPALLLAVAADGAHRVQRNAAPGASGAEADAGAVAVAPPPPPVVRRDLPDAAHPVMLGIDVLESDGFAEVRGKSIGLLTHPAGVDMRGLSTIDVLRHAPGVRLLALFAPEHGVRGDYPASANVPERVDAATGLMVHSIYHGNLTKPTRLQLKGLDAVVIDLQDIGSRSYTFISAMKTCMEGCFEAGVQVIVLDRPNPLGGLKVDGPPLDTQWMSNVGAFRVPYVHGLTIGELAHMAKEAPDILRISETARLNGRLTIIPMRGWRRSMRWPETGLHWVPTSHYVPDFSAVEGYPMTGPGCERGGFKNGIGTAYPFRGLSYHGVRIETLERDLKALALPGIGFRRVERSRPEDGRPRTRDLRRDQRLGPVATDRALGLPHAPGLQIRRAQPVRQPDARRVPLACDLLGLGPVSQRTGGPRSSGRRRRLHRRLAGQGRRLPAAGPAVLALSLSRLSRRGPQLKSPTRGPQPTLGVLPSSLPLIP